MASWRLSLLLALVALATLSWGFVAANADKQQKDASEVDSNVDMPPRFLYYQQTVIVYVGKGKSCTKKYVKNGVRYQNRCKKGTWCQNLKCQPWRQVLPAILGSVVGFLVIAGGIYLFLKYRDRRAGPKPNPQAFPPPYGAPAPPPYATSGAPYAPSGPPYGGPPYAPSGPPYAGPPYATTGAPYDASASSYPALNPPYPTSAPSYPAPTPPYA